MTERENRVRTYVAFLRGINVGAHNRMKMAALRDLCESLGFENVQPYIQSGNVVFETDETDTRALGTELADAIHASFDYDITVMIRTRAELDNIVDQQPFEEQSDENTKLYVTFLREEPGAEQVRSLLSAENEAEGFATNGREVYSEVRKNRLKNGRFTDVGKVLGTSVTRRNWNVVKKVHALTA